MYLLAHCDCRICEKIGEEGATGLMGENGYGQRRKMKK